MAAVEDLVAQFDDGQSGPLGFLPLTAQQPLLHLAHQHLQVLRVGPHQRVELSEFARTEKNLEVQTECTSNLTSS